MIKQYDIFGNLVETDGFGNPLRCADDDNNCLTTCDMCDTLCEDDYCSVECVEAWIKKYLS